ncbi:MAG: M48 family metalloprotease [Deltaproteobacteria bacterium]|jgi:Zn-dependent protease with chaperone function|nr:M48 family metalloprotease [Deltaproteobacteria bacterium]
MEEFGSTDFFQWQRSSRLWSVLFVLVFVAAALIWFVVINFGLDFIFVHFLYKQKNLDHRIFITQSLYITPPMLATVIFAGYTFFCSLARLHSIKENGSTYVATALGGIPLGETESVINSPAGRKQETVLKNVVSEMAIASRMPEPDIYILPRETSINAMATGLNSEEAAVLVTRGALKYLTRQELSGIIGHEFSHILNGDMRHNTLMAGWLHGFFSLTTFGQKILFKGSYRSLCSVPMGVFLIIIGFLGKIVGKIIQSAFNRRREYLADASSVQFTRNPLDLAGVLKKVGGLDQGSRIMAKNALDCRHFFLATPDKSIFRTHPPLEDRIWALDPNWNGHWHDFEKNPVDFLAEPKTKKLPSPDPKKMSGI